MRQEDARRCGFYTSRCAACASRSATAAPPAPAAAVGTPDDVLPYLPPASPTPSHRRVDTWVTQNWSTSEGMLPLDGRQAPDQRFHRHPRQPEPRLDDRRCRALHGEFTTGFTGWPPLVPVRQLRPQGERQRRAQRPPRPVRNAPATRSARSSRPAADLPLRQVTVYGVAEPPALAVPNSRSRTPSSRRERPATSTSSSTGRWFPTTPPRSASTTRPRERSNATRARLTFTPTSGTLTFINGGNHAQLRRRDLQQLQVHGTRWRASISPTRSTSSVAPYFQGWPPSRTTTTRPEAARRLRAGRVPVGLRAGR